MTVECVGGLVPEGQFKAGDTVTVTYRIKEGDKDRLQKFK